jgi:hypothetical protein
LENPEEMDTFVGNYDHIELNQENINYPNRSITYTEIEAAIKSLPKRKVQDLTESLLNSTTPIRQN